jgi:hypothetical protein
MRKLVVFLVFVLGSLQFAQGQPAFVEICQGDSYTWYLDTPPTSQVIIRSIKNYGIGPDATTYDTINDNKIVLTPQVYTVYDVISINGDSNMCNPSLEIEVKSIPTPIINTSGQNILLSTTYNGGNVPIIVHITNNNALVYHYSLYPNDTVQINSITPGEYNIYLTVSTTHCKSKTTITIP